MKKIKLLLLLMIVFTFSACTDKNIDNKKETVSKKIETNTAIKDLEKGKTNDEKQKLDNKSTKEKSKLEEKKNSNELNKEKTKDTKTSNKEDENSKVKSSNKVIVVDPGHASKGDLKMEPVSPNSSVKKYRQTDGADGVITKTPEYKVNMNVALKLKKYLQQRGFTVIMTKTDNNKTMSNIERAKIGNNANAALVIRLHADSSESKSTNGASMLIPSNSGSTKDIYKQSKVYGEKLISTLTKEVGMKNRGVIERSDLTGFNWSKVPVVLVEMGFLSNPDEDKKLSSSEYQNKIANALSQGVSYILQ